jgi:Family of unknown function (DUF5681)
VATEEIPEEQGKNRESVGYGKPPIEHRFKPGQSPNPGGRPKGRSVSSRLRELLENEAGKNGKQIADLLAEVIIKAALKGDHKFVETVLNRTEGKIVDSPPSKPIAEMTDKELADIVGD